MPQDSHRHCSSMTSSSKEARMVIWAIAQMTLSPRGLLPKPTSRENVRATQSQAKVLCYHASSISVFLPTWTVQLMGPSRTLKSLRCRPAEHVDRLGLRCQVIERKLGKLMDMKVQCHLCPWATADLRQQQLHELINRLTYFVHNVFPICSSSVKEVVNRVRNLLEVF